MSFSGLQDDSCGSLGAAFSGLHMRTLEGKAKEKETGKIGAKDDRESQHERSEDVFSNEKCSESWPGATGDPMFQA